MKYNTQDILKIVTDSASTILTGNEIQKYHGKTAARRRINARKCKDLSNVTRYIGKAGIRMSLTAAKDRADVHSCIRGLGMKERGQGMENHVNGFRQIAGNARKIRSESEQRTKGMMIILVSLYKMVRVVVGLLSEGPLLLQLKIDGVRT